MCSYLRRGSTCVRQLHLSHNRLSRAGIAEILTTLSSRPYPQQDARGMQPTFLRAEYNGIDRPAEFLQGVQRECSAFSFCHCEYRKFKGCSPNRCSAYSRPWDGPTVHLCYFANQ